MRFEKLETFQPITITLESEEDFHDIAYALQIAISNIEEHDTRLKQLQKMLEELDNLVLTTCYNT